MSTKSVDQITALERTRRQILQRADSIPALPELVSKALVLLGQPDKEIQDLALLLERDPVLVGKMLALVNSPFYGLTRAIRTVKDSVMVLGFRGVRSLLLATSTARYLERDYSCYGLSSRGLWSHSLTVGSACRQLSKMIGLDGEAQEELFVAGLLHDIGKMLIVPHLVERKLDTSGFEGTTEQFEESHVGINHAEAGALVAEKWNLTSMVRQLVRHHHDGQEPDDSRTPGAVLRLCDDLAHELGFGFAAGRARRPEFRTADRQQLGLGDDARWNEVQAAVETAAADAIRDLSSLGGG